uniref:BTB domain-containing protein n=1 Tax=Entomoneis paludosa TaxID=265537 RepID=A0A7S2YRC0_9STRA|mmetsp:Transcript_6951/g.14513  ORF Transcript_6951/g.14513 Transcript_6951/m.14513 type:complete len:372 (+) Transcript_6951:118-1233(+)|eukprot:CAMPEP_0172448742 /NCGR_PEP_ID=MMETSP1065-20121228/7686_1 /TAXON_ID=265537 /ORGANISM="Amphiprora paludosa, Strain CCMP125" /LENGTH=371 /DNA_ID=CAMNT_0013200317 /DNA_START=67 /DNA_END=1182 /DNA_ORIENTATION=-
MAANNGNGRQGNSQMNEHVEFSVKAEEDLYLTGAENTIRRVTAETNYSCLMLKTQRFSSLFRHYAKYHGLRKDDLEYYFVNLLENEDTPESVQLQRGDTIMVRKKRRPEPPAAAADDDEFFKDMKELLDDEEHMDALFHISPEEDDDEKHDPDNVKMESRKSAPTTIIKAHKSILTARAEYFKALFRSGAGGSQLAFKESQDCIIKVETCFNAFHIRACLEFIYTNRIVNLRTINTDDLLRLLHLSDRWLLRDLKRLIEHELIRDHMRVDTVARMYGATEEFTAQRLQSACIEFIMTNLRQLAGNQDFEEEMKNYPHLCMPVLKAAADLIPEPAPKKQRTDHHHSHHAGHHHHGGTPSSAVGSSPVPDSDT